MNIMRKLKKLLPLLMAAAFAAGEADAADLLSMYREAIGYDAQFASARAGRDADLEKLPQGQSRLLPTVGFSANTQWNDISSSLRTSPTMSLGPFWGYIAGKAFPQDNAMKYNSNGWSLSLSQPLFRWQNWMTYQQSELAVAQAEVQYKLAKQDLIQRVVKAYFDVLLSQENLVTAQAQKTAIAEQLAAAKRNFEVGTTTITDTHEAQARFDLTTAQEIAAESDLQIKRHTLSMLTGKEMDNLKKIRDGVEISSPQPDDISKWVESAEKENLGVQIGQAGLEMANREIEKQRAGHFPTLDLVASRGVSSMGVNPSLPVLGGSDTSSTVVGLQLNIPLYTGGIVSSKNREAVALREKARADLDNVRRNAALGARQSYLGVTSGLAQVKALEQALVSSQSALDSNKLGYDVGVRVNMDVLNAQQQFYSTRRDLAKARLDTLTAQLNLKAVIGALSETDVVEVNSFLE
jgi:outer membrane protein